VTRDRAGAVSFQLTQEFLSYMMDAPRASVTTTAGSFQRAGLMGCRRGATLLDKQGPEAASWRALPRRQARD